MSKDLFAKFGEEKIMDWRKSYDIAPPSMYDLDFLYSVGIDGLGICTSHMDPKYLNSAEMSRTQFALSKWPDVHSKMDTAFRVRSKYPTTESLKDCQERAYSYWKLVIAPRVLEGDRVLVVAHANTIRALVKAIDNIDDEKIRKLKIPNGVPLVYTLDRNLKPVDITDDLGFQAKYLVSSYNHSKVSSIFC